MAWIPLLLAGWFVVDVLIVAVLLVLTRRPRRRERHAPSLVADLRQLPASVGRGDAQRGSARSAVPTR